MSRDKVRVKIYEGDPFTGCCGPGLASRHAIEKLRKMLMERNKIVKNLREEFKEQLVIEREIVSRRRRHDTYPPHTYKLLQAGTQVLFMVINGQLVLEGAFPSLEDFRAPIRKTIEF